MCVLIKDGKDDKEEQKDENGLVEERFLISPGFALDKVKDKCDEMATLAQTNISQSIEFIKSYSHKKDEAIKANEKRLDDYEDQLETYLVKISSIDLNVSDSMRLNNYSHAIGNFERMGDYGYNILKIKRKCIRIKFIFQRKQTESSKLWAGQLPRLLKTQQRHLLMMTLSLQ